MEAAVVGMLGALLVLILSKVLDRVLEMRRRHDRTLDLLTALHAEIVAGTAAASLQTDDEEARYAEENETPFAPADETDFVFESIKSDLSLLPVEVAHEVVLYYKLAMRSNIYTNDTRHPLFQQQTPDEKRKYMRNLGALLREQQAAGLAALTAIEMASAIRFGADLGRKRRVPGSDTINERTDRTSHDSHLA
ncbi:hypothetical protein [Prosthecodimorpha staleyi]|uniref:Uncharacterized protein n=1 Tax=Prosthecodimorpha staleyi TaxID=2840188 RepID=A0A947D1K8_9HYPH|nr:hypothetical protein [Prosthecodimorpha staleyi]MBT9289275.1 hypothetical protein [Prosthecodimorpha staleyi]